ncbi:MAG: hypothetical protein UX28_C0003G0087 [Candidatus Pacebacteria bacterium GW2011_GWA1_46_10]|nr:MAG: hypothetical protein UX28_C0003G0087 [Candidatus Pacebacteria bacterium GW2011_GWA1_46_10]HCR81286.1 hypothetical protein [Candidatus Paceibacterota bacterium]
MTDDTTQDPLAALQDVIKEKQPGNAATGAEPEVDPAAEEAKQRQQLADLEAKQQQEDETALQAQLADLHQVTSAAAAKTSPPAPAEETPPTTQESEQSGFEIRQVDHTKIQKGP